MTHSSYVHSRMKLQRDQVQLDWSRYLQRKHEGKHLLNTNVLVIWSPSGSSIISVDSVTNVSSIGLDTCPVKLWIFYISCHQNKLFFFFFTPDGVFYKHSRRFPPCPVDNRTCLLAQAHSGGGRVAANKFTLYFIGLTSWQTLSRCAVEQRHSPLSV